MMGFSAALGPSLGGLLVQRFGWASIFFVNLPPLLLSALVSRACFKPGAQAGPRTVTRFDAAGALLMAAALLCLVFGLGGRPLLLLPAAGLLGLFIWWQGRAAQPLMDPRLFAERSFAAGCAMMALQNLGMYALLFQLPYRLAAGRTCTA